MGLGHQPGCGHAQKPETEIDEIEHQTAKRRTANKTGIIKPSHHGGIGSTNKREGYVCQKDGPADRPDSPPAGMLAPVGSSGRLAACGWAAL